MVSDLIIQFRSQNTCYYATMAVRYHCNGIFEQVKYPNRFIPIGYNRCISHSHRALQVCPVKIINICDFMQHRNNINQCSMDDEMESSGLGISGRIAKCAESAYEKIFGTNWYIPLKQKSQH